ncbi:MAG: hypothetical protein H7X77_06635 [Anaerolineae bacterium]|nr:hypothetical protein [Anaerolineae bacterium]
MVDETLIDALMNAGLVQFGYFAEMGQTEFSAVRFHLALLPAYPDVLKILAVAIAERLSKRNIERLVCTADSIPLGVAVSLETGIPLIYSRGHGEVPVYDLVGAYDVGHPAALVMNIFEQSAMIANLQSNAHRVGLNIEFGVAVLGLNRPSELIEPLIGLEEMVDSLVVRGKLPAKPASDNFKTVNPVRIKASRHPD